MESTVAQQPSPDAEQPSLPAPLRRIVVFGCLALAAGLGVAKLATRPHVHSFAGTLTARLVPITSERAGVISQWHVAEGDALAITQPIASIADPSVDRRRQQLDTDIVRLRAELDRALAAAELELDWRMKDVNETIFTARLQSAEYLEERHRHEMEKVALTDLLSHNSTAFWTQPDTVIDSLVLRESTTQSSRLNTILRLESATNSSEVCAAQVDLCDEQIDWLEALKQKLPDRIRKSTGVDIAEQKLEQAKDEREELDEAESVVVINSSAIGRAGVFFKRVGDYAAVGEPIVEVLDDSQRFVVVEVPSGKVADFEVGREVAVLFSGDVARKGRVVRIAPQAVQREGDAGATGTVVRIHIEQAGGVWPSVPIGARVDVCLL